MVNMMGCIRYCMCIGNFICYDFDEIKSYIDIIVIFIRYIC